MKFGYARVSTLQQDLESQLQTLEKEGCEKIYSEKFTGTKADRPEFNKLMEELKEGDTLVVTKLDRFARSMMQGSQLVSELISKGIRVHILNIGIMDNTPASKLIRNIFFSFAEFERDMIYERTQEGKAIAKQNPDFREGRPRKFGRKHVENALNALKTSTYREVEEEFGISKSTLIRAKKRIKKT